MLIIAYVMIMVILPVAFYLFEYETKPVKVSIGLDLQNHSLTLFGDQFVINEVYLNSKRLMIVKDKGAYSTDEVKYDYKKSHRIRIIDVEKKEIELNFVLLPIKQSQKKYLKVFSRIGVHMPKVAINNTRQYLSAQNTLDTRYRLLGETNAYLDVTYSKTPFKIKLAAFTSSSFLIGKDVVVSVSRGGYRLMNFAGKLIMGTLKLLGRIIVWISRFVFNLSMKILRFCGRMLLGIARWIKMTMPKVFNVTKKIVKATTHLITKIAKFAWKGISFVLNAIKWLFQSVFKVIYFILRSIFNAIKWVFNSVIRFFIGIKNAIGNVNYYIVKGRKINVLENKVVVNSSDLETKSFSVGSTQKNLSLQLKDGLGRFIASEDVRLVLKVNNKTASKLLDTSTQVSNSHGEVSFGIQFGEKVYPHKLLVLLRNKKVPIEIRVVAADPNILINNEKEVVLIGGVGRTLKKAFSMEVTDKYGNRAPNAVIDFYEKESDDGDLLKYAEKKSDADGRLVMDYQMEDEARKFFIVAKLKKNPAQSIMYSIRIKAKHPETIEIVGLDERQAIVGIPIKEPFSVELLDKFENPVSDMKIVFTLVSETYDDVAEKSTRTDKNGIASVKFNTPKEVGEFQVIASVEKSMELEAATSLLVLPGSAARIVVVSGNNQLVDWGQDLKIPLKFQVFDGLGNPIPDVEVNWKKPKQSSWIEKEDRTDIDGNSIATLKIEKTTKKEVFAIAKVGKAKAVFKIKPREPSLYKLYLLSKPIVQVFADQRLAKPITFVLKDQYDHILGNTEVIFEYIVTRRGIQYLQNIKHATNESGMVSINFLVSDQKDKINFKGKYYKDKKPVITWVTIEVIPEDISFVKLDRTVVTATVRQKLEKPIEVFVGDNHDRPVSDLNLDLVLTRAPPGKMEKIQTIRVQTDRKGYARFSPPIGEIAGEYIYAVKIKKLSQKLIVNALADKANQIKITSKGANLYPVGAEVKDFRFVAFDEYNNLLKKSYFYYDIRSRDRFFFGMKKKMRILKHRFNKKVYTGEEGVGKIDFNVPEEAGEYYLYISDEDYNVRVYYPFKAKGVRTHSITVIEQEEEPIEYYVGEKISNLFAFHALDKFGNPSKKVKISLDLYLEGSKKSSQGVDTQTNAKGKGSFSIEMPEKRGVYLAVIYPQGLANIEKRITVNLLAKGIEKAVIIAGDNQLVNINTKFKQDFILKVEDFYGNPVSGSEIRWSYTQEVKGDVKTVTITKKTKSDGTSLFNFVNDGESGVREIKAQYKRNNKWEFLSFYVKIVSNVADRVKKVSGDNQKATVGVELISPLVIKVLDSKGFPISELPVVYELMFLENNKRKNLSPIYLYTNENGIATAKFTAPLNKGAYEVIAYPKQDKSKKVKFSLTVIPDSFNAADEQVELTSKKQTKQLYKLLPVNDVNIQLKQNEKQSICHVMLVDQNNKSVSWKKINWEIYDSKANQTYTRISKTDEKGFTQITEIDTSVPRILIIKAIEKIQGSSIVFNVEVKAATTGKDSSDNRKNQEANSTKKPELSIRKKRKKSDYVIDKTPSTKARVFENECVITVKDDNIIVSRKKEIQMYTKGTPFKLIIHNKSEKPSKYIVEIKERKWTNTIELGFDEKGEIIILPANTELKETIRVYQKQLWLFGKKQLFSMKLLTNDSNTYSLVSLDDSYKNVVKTQPVDFRFQLLSKEPTDKKFFNVIVSAKNLNNGEYLITDSVYPLIVNRPIIYEYAFNEVGLHQIEVISEISNEKLSYYINVSDLKKTDTRSELRERTKKDNRLKAKIKLEEEKRKLLIAQLRKRDSKKKTKQAKSKTKQEVSLTKVSGGGVIQMEPVLTVIPNSLRVLIGDSAKRDETIVWEIIKHPEGTDVQFEKETVSDQDGVALNVIIVKSIAGEYIIRAKLKTRPSVFVDFMMDLY